MNTLSLREFRRLPADEICARINEMSNVKSHYDPEVMKQYGYDFTWMSMRKVAEELGLTYGFFDGEKAPAEGNYRRITVELKGKSDYHKKSIFCDEEALALIEKMTKDIGDTYGKAAILSAIIREGTLALEKAGQKGNISFTAPAMRFDNLGENAQ